MNNPTSQNITILHDTREWSTDLDGEIGEIRVDGEKLNSVHDLAIKVEGIAQSIKTLVLCLGAIVLICLLCNVGMATWVATHDDEIMEAVDSTLARNSEVTNRIAKLNNTYAKKLESMGLKYRDGKWQQFGNTSLEVSK